MVMVAHFFTFFPLSYHILLPVFLCDLGRISLIINFLLVYNPFIVLNIPI